MPLHEKSLDMMVGWIKEMAVDLDSSQHHQSGGISCQEQSFQSLASRVRSVLWLRRQDLQTADGFLIQVLSYACVQYSFFFPKNLPRLN
jgi:hypothetical protein